MLLPGESGNPLEWSVRHQTQTYMAPGHNSSALDKKTAQDLPSFYPELTGMGSSNPNDHEQDAGIWEQKLYTTAPKWSP
ncbi:hypothetical protein OJAV_G00043730 [Oryzias javanicus]|uniref:Uncharacterized protein n=1 Tax=Oryzias javanicus TaxID=123683 RepID=A0A3S2N3A6_ORYJA|nr:hypothetical protein OJAV_G00043730 [Oryzias javanicus]